MTQLALEYLTLPTPVLCLLWTVCPETMLNALRMTYRASRYDLAMCGVVWVLNGLTGAAVAVLMGGWV